MLTAAAAMAGIWLVMPCTTEEIISIPMLATIGSISDKLESISVNSVVAAETSSGATSFIPLIAERIAVGRDLARF